MTLRQWHTLSLLLEILVKILDLKLENKSIWESCENIKIQKFFAKGYTPDWSEEVFVVKKS